MRVIVEVHPFGMSDAKRTIASIDIANVSELAAVSDYEAVATLADRAPPVRVRIDGHRRAVGWELLVGRVIDAVWRASRMGATERQGDPG